MDSSSNSVNSIRSGDLDVKQLELVLILNETCFLFLSVKENIFSMAHFCWKAYVMKMQKIVFKCSYVEYI